MGDEMTTTDGDERDGSFVQGEGLEVVALNEEINGNQVDLVGAGPSHADVQRWCLRRLRAL